MDIKEVQANERGERGKNCLLPETVSLFLTGDEENCANILDGFR
jgi:hypothetical protein